MHTHTHKRTHMQLVSFYLLLTTLANFTVCTKIAVIVAASVVCILFVCVRVCVCKFVRDKKLLCLLQHFYVAVAVVVVVSANCAC